MEQNNKLTSVLIFLSGLAFLFVPLIFSPHPPEELNYFFSQPTIRDFIANCLLLGFFLLNFKILITRYYFTEKYIIYICIIVISFLIICFLPSIITGNNPFSQQNQNFQIPSHGTTIPAKPAGSTFVKEINHHIFLFLAVILGSAFLREKVRSKTIENEKLAAELSHLKTQIHPHFLFNTLNSIYAMSIMKDDKASENIVKLAEFMRYLLQESNQEQVILAKEIDYINNYIDLQKTRLRDSIELDYRTKGDFSRIDIAPLLLFPFIENAFKYGVNPDENCSIKISIAVKENNLTLNVSNKIVSSKNIESSKIGVKNTKERLELYYPKKHKLIIEQNNEFYKVALFLELKNN